MATHFHVVFIWQTSVNIWGSSSRRKSPMIIHHGNTIYHYCILCQISWIGEKLRNSSSTNCHNMPSLSTTVKKCVLHIYTPRQTSVPNFMKLVKNWGKLRDFSPIFASNISATHFLPLAHLHPKANIWCQTWELAKNLVRGKIFTFLPCTLPWQQTFYHCQKMCLAHLPSVPNFMRHWWKTEEVVPLHFCHNMPLPSTCHCRKMCVHIYTPRQNLCQISLVKI